MHFLKAFDQELRKDNSSQLLFSTLSLNYADVQLRERIDRVSKLQACLQRLAGLGADFCHCHARPGPDVEGRFFPFFLVGLLEDSVPAVRVLLLRLRTCPECQHAISESTCSERQDAALELQRQAVAVVECDEVLLSARAPPRYSTYYVVIHPAVAGQPHGYTWVRTTDEAAAWLEAHVGLEAGQVEGLLRNLDFSTPLHCRRIVSHALLAVADWVLTPGQSGKRCGPASAAAASTGAQRGGNLAAALRPWALVAQRDPQLLLYGSAVRPYVPSRSDPGSPDGASLLEVLSAPPFHLGLARSRGKALRLQRLAALLRVQDEGQGVSSETSIMQLSAKILELMHGADHGDKHDHGRHQQQQQQQRPPHLKGEANRLQVTGGSRAPGPVSGGCARPPNAVEELLRELGAQPKEVLKAIEPVGCNIAMCAECGRQADLAGCTRCVDSFCSHCLRRTRLRTSWCCWYCVAVLPHLATDQYGAASDLYEAITRLTAHGMRAGNRLHLVSDELAGLVVSARRHLLHHKLRIDYLLHMPDFWAGLVTVSGWAVRQFTEIYDNTEAPPLGRDSTGGGDGDGAGAITASPLGSAARQRGANAEVASGFYELLAGMLRAPSDPGPKLKLPADACFAFLRGDFLQACSRLLAAVGRDLQLGSGPDGTGLQLLLLVLPNVSGLVSAMTACGTLSNNDCLFAELVQALYDSQLLEHLARALLWLQEALVGAVIRGELEDEDTDLVAGPLSPYLIRHDLHNMLVGIPSSLMNRLGAATATEDAAARLEALVPLLRRSLSGPCLQYLVGRDLVAARWRLTGGEGPTYGLMGSELDMATPFAPDAALEAHLLEQLFESAFLWQVTVRGSPSPPNQQPAAQSAPGPTGSGPWFGGATWPWANGLWARAPPYSDQPPAGTPYSVIALYEMVYNASANVVAAWPGGLFRKLSEPLRLLMRLATELGPLHIKERLPKLWRLLAQALMLGEEFQDPDFIVHIGELMVRDWPVESPGEQQQPSMAGEQGAEAAVLQERQQQPQPEPAEELEQQAQQDQQPAMAEQQPGSGAMDMSSAAPSDGNGGPEPGSRSHPTADCTFGLRCALDGGLLPAVERMMRNDHWRTPFAPEMDSRAFRLYIVEDLLRVSGVWPAVVAHGSFREVASLIATLRKMPRVVVAAPAALPTRQGYGDAICDTDSRPSRVAKTYFLALLEQTAAVLLAGAPKEDGGEPRREEGGGAAGGSDEGDQKRSGSISKGSSSAAGDAGAAAASGSSPSGGGGGGCGASTSTFVAPPPPATAPRSAVPLNNSLKATDVPIHLQRLLQAAGAPPSGWSADARQQAHLLTVFALVQWLPLAMELHPYVGLAPTVGRAAWFWVLVAALQCLAAGSSGLADPYQSWRRFLLNDLDVLTRLAAVFEECTSPSSAAAAQVCQELLPVALDVLEVLAALWPLKLVMRVAVGTGMVAVLEGRCGRRLVVEELRGPGSRRPDGSGLAPQRVQLVLLQEEEPDALPDVVALRPDVAAKHDLAHLPLLPSPAEAVRAAAAAGVRVCGNPGCLNLEGPSEAALTAAGGKTCSRCKAVWYCCGVCQLAHWRARHQGECDRLGW